MGSNRDKEAGLNIKERFAFWLLTKFEPLLASGTVKLLQYDARRQREFTEALRRAAREGNSTLFLGAEEEHLLDEMFKTEGAVQ